MRLLILIILSTFIFISCTKENLVKEVKVYYKNGHPKVVHFYEKRGLFFRELKKKKYFSEDGKLQKNESYLGQIANGKWILTSDIDFSVPLFQILNWKRKDLSIKNI